MINVLHPGQLKSVFQNSHSPLFGQIESKYILLMLIVSINIIDYGTCSKLTHPTTHSPNTHPLPPQHTPNPTISEYHSNLINKPSFLLTHVSITSIPPSTLIPTQNGYLENLLAFQISLLTVHSVHVFE